MPGCMRAARVAGLTETVHSGGRTPHCCMMYTQSSPVDTLNIVKAALPAVAVYSFQEYVTASWLRHILSCRLPVHLTMHANALTGSAELLTCVILAILRSSSILPALTGIQLGAHGVAAGAAHHICWVLSRHCLHLNLLGSF